MDDTEIHERIEQLVADEHELQQRHGGHGLDEAEHARLEQVGIALDRLWDLMRQRRARREAGLDPDGASVRDAGTVEDYLQ